MGAGTCQNQVRAPPQKVPNVTVEEADNWSIRFKLCVFGITLSQKMNNKQKERTNLFQGLLKNTCPGRVVIRAVLYDYKACTLVGVMPQCSFFLQNRWAEYFYGLQNWLPL